MENEISGGFILVDEKKLLVECIKKGNSYLSDFISSNLNDTTFGLNTSKRKQITGFIELMDSFQELIEFAEIKNINILLLLIKDCYNKLLTCSEEDCKLSFIRTHRFVRSNYLIPV